MAWFTSAPRSWNGAAPLSGAIKQTALACLLSFQMGSVNQTRPNDQIGLYTQLTLPEHRLFAHCPISRPFFGNTPGMCDDIEPKIHQARAPPSGCAIKGGEGRIGGSIMFVRPCSAVKLAWIPGLWWVLVGKAGVTAASPWSGGDAWGGQSPATGPRSPSTPGEARPQATAARGENGDGVGNVVACHGGGAPRLMPGTDRGRFCWIESSL